MRNVPNRGPVVATEAGHFYDAFLGGCGNEMIRDTIRSLQARVSFLRATSMARADRHPASMAEMTRIVEAIEARDPDAAEAACKEHVRRARASAFEVMRQTTPAQNA